MAIFKKSKENVEQEEDKLTWQQKLVRDLSDLPYILAVFLVIYMLVFRVVVVVGPSMYNTLIDGDRLVLLSNVLYTEPKQGDIIVASKKSFEGGECIVKRVIATEGQTVDIDFNAGIVYVDGIAIDEPYTYTATTLDEGVVFQENGKIDLYYKLINSQELNNLWLKAVRREYVNIPAAFSSLGNLKHGEDLLLSAQFITATPRIVFVKEGLYHYRVREGSVTHVFSMQRFESVKTVHNELDQYIEYWQMPELKPVHNTTKVSGCVNTFRGLIKNRHTMTKQEFRSHLQALRTDPYFTVSYRNMEWKHLSRSYRLYALCLYHGCYAVPMIWVAIKKFLSKM